MKKIALIALILILFGVCQTIVNVKGSVNFDFDFSVLEERGYDVTRVVVKMTHGSGKTRKVELGVEDGIATGRVDGLEIGTWHLEVEVYEEDTLITTGNADVEIRPGEITDVAINVQPVTGSLNITVVIGESPGEAAEGLRMESKPKYVEFVPQDGWHFRVYIINDSSETVDLQKMERYARSEDEDFHLISEYDSSTLEKWFGTTELEPGKSFNFGGRAGPLDWPGYQWKFVLYAVGKTSNADYRAEVVITFENPILVVAAYDNSLEVLSQDQPLEASLTLISHSSTPVEIESIEEYGIEQGGGEYELIKIYDQSEIEEMIGSHFLNPHESKTITFRYDEASWKRLKYVVRASMDGEEIVRELEFYILVRSRDYDTWNLRINADFEVEIATGVWWVPANELGETDYTNEEIAQIAENDTPEQKREKIDTLYEAIQLYQISVFKSANDNVHYQPDPHTTWEYHKPGYHSVRTNEGCCAASMSWLYYILEGDYEELGFVEYAKHNGGGHVFNYIKHNGWYYIIDMTHHRVDMVERGTTPVESGSLQDFYRSDRTLGPIFKVRDLQDYADYLLNLMGDKLGFIGAYVPVTEEAPPIGTYFDEDGNRVRGYPLYMEGRLRILYDDPDDSLVIGYSATPDYYPDWESIPTADIEPLLPPFP